MRRFVVFPMGFALVAACSSSHSSPPGPPDASAPTSMVVGITSDDFGGALASVHVTTTIDGAPATDDTINVAQNPKWAPKEIKLAPAAGKTSGDLEVTIDGFLSATPAQGEPPILVRLAKGSFVANQASLMHVNLDAQCQLALPGGPPGGPTCTAPTTCVAGNCVDDAHADPPVPYSSDWASNTPDVCKPANAGPPAVQVGTGQTDYLPLNDGDTVQLEQGPQGGHHIWIATRMKNLRQAGSTTTITAVQPGTGSKPPPTSFVFTYDTDEGGFCKLSGLRFQLDAGGGDYHPYLGQPLDITVTIKDTSGATGAQTVHVNVAPTVLCPSGVPGC